MTFRCNRWQYRNSDYICTKNVGNVHSMPFTIFRHPIASRETFRRRLADADVRSLCCLIYLPLIHIMSSLDWIFADLRQLWVWPTGGVWCLEMNLDSSQCYWPPHIHVGVTRVEVLSSISFSVAYSGYTKCDSVESYFFGHL